MNSKTGGKLTTREIDARAGSKATPSIAREQDALYQEGRVVARALDPQVDLAAKEIRFSEVCNSDWLLIPDECEFQEYRILVKKIDDATKVSRESPHKGRILRGVTANILGYRSQQGT